MNCEHDLKLVRTNVWECSKDGCDYSTGRPSKPGTKADEGKTRWDLIPAEFAAAIGCRDLIVDVLNWHHDRQGSLATIARQIVSEGNLEEPIDDLSRVLVHGCEKYEIHNWKKVPDLERRYVSAACRHLRAAQFNFRDEESGLPHDAHALTCIAFLLWNENWPKTVTVELNGFVAESFDNFTGTVIGKATEVIEEGEMVSAAPIVRKGDPGYRYAKPLVVPEGYSAQEDSDGTIHAFKNDRDDEDPCANGCQDTRWEVSATVGCGVHRCVVCGKVVR